MIHQDVLPLTYYVWFEAKYDCFLYLSHPLPPSPCSGVAGLAETFPSFPVSGPFLPDVPGFQAPPDSILPPQLRSSSRALPRPPSSFRQLLGCFLVHLFF